VNRRIAVAALIAAMLCQPNALALDWFDKCDHDHNHYWTWEEYRGARRAWERRHREEKRLSDAELRAEYERLDLDHDHRLSREEAKAWGRW
jgi:hypothetical protein